MKKYRILPQTQEDFFNAHEYLYERSPSAAESFAKLMFDAFELLGDFPALGHVRKDLTDKPFRFWPAGNYLIIYRPDLNPVPIVALIHGSQDVGQLLQQSQDEE